jgi:hypothetical protein
LPAVTSRHPRTLGSTIRRSDARIAENEFTQSRAYAMQPHRSTPVLFLLSSAREMAAALCPFFHRSHNSAFCAAVNRIRDVTMAHFLTS